MTKRCTGCGESKLVEAFCLANSTPDGRHTRCRTCRAAADRVLYLKQAVARKAAAKARYHANPEAQRTRQRERYAGDPLYRAACIKQAKGRRLKAYAARRANTVTRFADNLRAQIGRAFRLRGLEKREPTFRMLGYSALELYKYLSRWLGSMCEDCGLARVTVETAHMDHISPLATAKNRLDVLRLNRLDNLRLICAACNLHKHAREAA